MIKLTDRMVDEKAVTSVTKSPRNGGVYDLRTVGGGYTKLTAEDFEIFSKEINNLKGKAGTPQYIEINTGLVCLSNVVIVEPVKDRKEIRVVFKGEKTIHLYLTPEEYSAFNV